MSATIEDGIPPAAESMSVTGEAPDVLAADAAAWRALESVLSYDPVKAWRLVEMKHAYNAPDAEHPSPFVAFLATFERDPEMPTPRSKEEAEYWATADEEVQA